MKKLHRYSWRTKWSSGEAPSRTHSILTTVSRLKDGVFCYITLRKTDARYKTDTQLTDTSLSVFSRPTIDRSGRKVGSSNLAHAHDRVKEHDRCTNKNSISFLCLNKKKLIIALLCLYRNQIYF